MLKTKGPSTRKTNKATRRFHENHPSCLLPCLSVLLSFVRIYRTRSSPVSAMKARSCSGSDVDICQTVLGRWHFGVLIESLACSHYCWFDAVENAAYFFLRKAVGFVGLVVRATFQSHKKRSHRSAHYDSSHTAPTTAESNYTSFSL